MVSSKKLLEELRRILVKKMKVDEALSGEIIAELVSEFELVEPESLSKPVCRDADDDIVLATALAARAEVIVTGDADLLVLKKFQGIKIISPRQFVELLDAK